MYIDGLVHGILEDLERVAAAGDEASARAAVLLSSALEPALRMRIQDALGEAALELSEQLDPGRVEVHLVGRDLQLVAVDTAADSPETSGGEETLDARITLRLPERLKSSLETAAAEAGVSLNTYLVQSLGRAAEPRPTHSGGRRLTGYGRS